MSYLSLLASLPINSKKVNPYPGILSLPHFPPHPQRRSVCQRPALRRCKNMAGFALFLFSLLAPHQSMEMPLSPDSGTHKAGGLNDKPRPSRVDLIEHYTSKISEKDRFCDGAYGEVEFLRTCSVLERYLPRQGNILDVGGGPGVYAKWLLERGYAVNLLDIVPKHIEEATEMFNEIGVAPPRAQAVVGSAVSLPFSDCSADSLLLLGPLYHLTDRDDRRKALQEAFRVMKPGSKLFAAGISRFASLLDGLDRGFLWDPIFEGIVRRDLASGQHRNPTTNPEYWTDAYFHRPDELANEVRNAGFTDIRVLSVEGPIIFDRSLSQNWQDEKHRAMLLELAQQVEEEPALVGMSPHLLVVATKS